MPRRMWKTHVRSSGFSQLSASAGSGLRLRSKRTSPSNTFEFTSNVKDSVSVGGFGKMPVTSEATAIVNSGSAPRRGPHDTARRMERTKTGFRCRDELFPLKATMRKAYLDRSSVLRRAGARPESSTALLDERRLRRESDFRGERGSLGRRRRDRDERGQLGRGQGGQRNAFSARIDRVASLRLVPLRSRGGTEDLFDDLAPAHARCVSTE